MRNSPYTLRASRDRRNGKQALTESLSIRSEISTPNTRYSVESVNKSAFPDLIAKAREGLRFYSPELCEEGVNGTYFMKDKTGKTIAVFKPQDEEGNSENNPKSNNPHQSNNGLPSSGLISGEAALREVAACLIDREHFYGVPKTQLVKITHPFNKNSTQVKIGSLQEFVDNDGCSEEFGPSAFPVREVHKIGILDLQMFNVDRHSGNILVKKSNNKTTLVPIDQGFSLPDNLECLWFEWMNWSQSSLSFDDETKAYITRIDIDRDIAMLSRELSIRPECLRTMKIATTLLKKCALNDLNLFEIGSLVCRKSSDKF